jgi:glycosyltransferase involved in cell wall biosynthesis
MRILLVHNYYQIRGGEDESYEAETRLLRQMGHEVEVYEEKNDRLPAINPIDLAAKTIWSNSSYRSVREKLQGQKYDLLHVQNFFPLISPSVYYAAKAEGIPVVQSLRNYRLLCPNALFFRDGGVCEDCVGQPIPWAGVVHGCYRQSQIASAGVATMLTVHRLLRTWMEMVDTYITLTQFAKDKFVQGGLPADKIAVKPNFVDPDPGMGNGTGGYALYVGRLSVEKGIDTLLAAWEKLSVKMPLKIVGDGPLAEEVMAAAARSPQIEWLGRRPTSEVYDLMGSAMLLIFPSKWYETFGRVAVEAFAKGTPVVGANLGAIAELIETGRTGLLFRPGDADDLAAKIEWAIAHPQQLASMRQQARLEFEAKYTAQPNYHQLMEIYRRSQQ